MKIYVFSKETEIYAPGRMVEEGKLRGWDVQNLYYKDIYTTIGPKEVAVFHKGKKLEIPDGVILRVSGQGLKGPLFVYQRVGLVDYFPDSIKVMNKETYKSWPRLNKLEQHYSLVRAGIPVIPSITFASEDSIDWDKLKFPLVGKTTFGSSGQGVFKLKDKKELLDVAEEKGISTFIYQRLLPTRQDYRVIVIGGKALPVAMRKTAQGDDFRTNYARGGKVDQVELTPEMKKLAEDTAKLFKADYAGVDIMFDENNKPFILEINRGAQFQGFEESTGLNVASNVLDFFK